MTSTLNELGFRVADRILAEERQLIAAGWINHRELNDAGYRARLGGRHFAQDEHRHLYRYLCITAQHGGTPEVAEAVALSERDGVPLTTRDVFDIVLGIDSPDGRIPHYINVVLTCADRRNEIADVCRQYGDLLSDDQIEVTVKPRAPRDRTIRLEVPRHLQRRRRREAVAV